MNLRAVPWFRTAQRYLRYRACDARQCRQIWRAVSKPAALRAAIAAVLLTAAGAPPGAARLPGTDSTDLLFAAERDASAFSEDRRDRERRALREARMLNHVEGDEIESAESAVPSTIDHHGQGDATRQPAGHSR